MSFFHAAIPAVLLLAFFLAGCDPVSSRIDEVKTGKTSDQRTAAIKSLSERRDPRVAEALIGVLTDGKRRSDKEIEAAVRALGNRGEERAFDLLVSLALREAPSTSIRESAAEALAGYDGAKLTDAMLPVLADNANSNEKPRLRALAILGRADDPRALDFLIRTAKTVDDREGYESRVMLGKRQEPKAADALVEMALKSEKPGIQRDAASELAKMRSERATDAIIAALRDKNAKVRRAAANALERIKDERAKEALAANLKDADKGARVAAAVALGLLGDPRATDVLIASLRESAVQGSSDPIVGESDRLAKALAGTGSPQAVDTLIAALRNNKISSDAGKALYQLNDERGNAALAGCVADWSLGKLAVEVMQRSGKTPATPDDEVRWWVAQRQKEPLRANWERTRDVLRRDLESNSYPVMDNAIWAVMWLGVDDLMPLLVRLLEKKGDKDMAQAFLNSVHPKLKEAGRRWANERGYHVWQIGGGGN